MKNIFGTLALAASVLSGGAASATDYEPTLIYDTTYVSTEWDLDFDVCIDEFFDQIYIKTARFTVDGASEVGNVGISYSKVGGSGLRFTGMTLPGTITEITLGGDDHITCGSDRLMLPRVIAPPAAVPTMTEWAMILFGSILAGGAALYIQRRRLGTT